MNIFPVLVRLMLRPLLNSLSLCATRGGVRLAEPVRVFGFGAKKTLWSCVRQLWNDVWNDLWNEASDAVVAVPVR